MTTSDKTWECAGCDAEWAKRGEDGCCTACGQRIEAAPAVEGEAHLRFSFIGDKFYKHAEDCADPTATKLDQGQSGERDSRTVLGPECETCGKTYYNAKSHARTCKANPPEPDAAVGEYQVVLSGPFHAASIHGPDGRKFDLYGACRRLNELKAQLAASDAVVEAAAQHISVLDRMDVGNPDWEVDLSASEEAMRDALAAVEAKTKGGG